MLAARGDVQRPSTPVSVNQNVMSACEDAFVVAAVITVVVICGHQRRRQRRFWVRTSQCVKHRAGQQGVIHNTASDDVALLPSQVRDREMFHTFFQVSRSDSECLLNMVGSHIAERDTHSRKVIPTTDHLAVTMQFLWTGDSYSSLAYMFTMSK